MGRTLARKWDRATTDWELVREDDVLDLGAEVMIPDFAFEHPDGRRAILEIVGFWTPEYLEKKLTKIREADLDHLLVAVSERLARKLYRKTSLENRAREQNNLIWDVGHTATTSAI